jgi:hypothetical protein
MGWLGSAQLLAFASPAPVAKHATASVSGWLLIGAIVLVLAWVLLRRRNRTAARSLAAADARATANGGGSGATAGVQSTHDGRVQIVLALDRESLLALASGSGGVVDVDNGASGRLLGRVSVPDALPVGNGAGVGDLSDGSEWSGTGGVLAGNALGAERAAVAERWGRAVDSGGSVRAGAVVLESRPTLCPVCNTDQDRARGPFCGVCGAHL